MNWDVFFKAAGLASGLIVVPTFVWVWNTNTKVQQTQIELVHLSEDVEKMKSNSVDIQLIKKDIAYIKTNIDEVKTILKKEP